MDETEHEIVELANKAAALAERTPSDEAKRLLLKVNELLLRAGTEHHNTGHPASDA
jgi:hypothetical protein